MWVAAAGAAGPIAMAGEEMGVVENSPTVQLVAGEVKKVTRASVMVWASGVQVTVAAEVRKTVAARLVVGKAATMVWAPAGP